jgi:hypothetical protein
VSRERVVVGGLERKTGESMGFLQMSDDGGGVEKYKRHRFSSLGLHVGLRWPPAGLAGLTGWEVFSYIFLLKQLGYVSIWAEIKETSWATSSFHVEKKGVNFYKYLINYHKDCMSKQRG